MTNSRTSRVTHIAALISALSIADVVLGSGAFAQDGGRQDTADNAPRSLLRSQSDVEDQSPGSVHLPSSPGLEDTVTSSDLDAVGMEIFGVLEPADGGLGYDLWRGSSQRSIVPLMAALPVNSSSPIQQDLFMRLLLSRAFDPAREDRFGAQAGSRLVRGEVPFMIVRAKKLLAAGHLREAERALDQADEPLDDMETLHIRSEIFLLTGRTRAACSIAARTRGASDEAYWARLRALCYMVAEDRGAARLSADLLSETGYADPLFFAALANQIDGAGHSYENLPLADGIHFALLAHSAQDGFPTDVLNTRSPAVREASLNLARVSARGQGELLNVQIPLAEASVLAGSTRGPTGAGPLRALYAGVVMSETEVVRLASSAVLFDSGPDQSAKKSAAIYQALAAAVMPGDHADALKLAWDDASARDRRALFLAVYSEALAALPVAPELDIYAADFARASLLAGDYARASQWLALARGAPGEARKHSGSRAADNPLHDLDIALQIVAPDSIRGKPDSIRGKDRAKVKWNAADRLVHAATTGQARQARQALLEVRLYQALGGQLNMATRQALTEFPADVSVAAEGAMPPTGILSGLDAAARAGRKGETVLFTLLALAGPQGDSKSAQIPIIVIAKCVSALVRTGFIMEAKTLAIESLLADL